MAAVASGYVRFTYTINGGGYVDLAYLSLRGLDDPDDIEPFPQVANDHIDGSSNTQFVAFRRLPTIDLGVVSDRASRIALLYWMIDNARTIDYNSQESGKSEAGLAVVPQNPKEFKNVWLDGFSGARAFVFQLKESVVRTAFPV